MRLLPLKWCLKSNGDGMFTAVLVVQAVQQRRGIDFTELYAAVPKPMSQALCSSCDGR
jgi:hypothetical protein